MSGKQKCEDTGPLTKKRMEIADAEFLTAAEDFIGRAHQANKPFFVWFNTTRMHIWTHLASQVARLNARFEKEVIKRWKENNDERIVR